MTTTAPLHIGYLHIGNAEQTNILTSYFWTTVITTWPYSQGEVYSIQHYVIACQLHATGRWFSPDTPVSFTNKTDPPRYTWNVAKSGVKHHNPKPHIFVGAYYCCCYKILYFSSRPNSPYFFSWSKFYFGIVPTMCFFFFILLRICINEMLIYTILLIVLHQMSWSWSMEIGFTTIWYNQCLSPLKLWVRTPSMARCTRYNIMW
jgi:hypothetical protein